MEYFYFLTDKERNTFFLECLALGIWAQLDYGQSGLYGVSVNIEKTFNKKNSGE